MRRDRIKTDTSCEEMCSECSFGHVLCTCVPRLQQRAIALPDHGGALESDDEICTEAKSDRYLKVAWCATAMNRGCGGASSTTAPRLLTKRPFSRKNNLFPLEKNPSVYDTRKTNLLRPARAPAHRAEARTMGGRSTERGPTFCFVSALFCYGFPLCLAFFWSVFRFFSHSSKLFSAMFWPFSGVFPAFSGRLLECSPLVLPSLGVFSWRLGGVGRRPATLRTPAADRPKGEPVERVYDDVIANKKLARQG